MEYTILERGSKGKWARRNEDEKIKCDGGKFQGLRGIRGREENNNSGRRDGRKVEEVRSASIKSLLLQ